MVPRFPGFPPEGIEFFRKLMRNNRREWFQPRKEIFDTQLKQPMSILATCFFNPSGIGDNPAGGVSVFVSSAFAFSFFSGFHRRAF